MPRPLSTALALLSLSAPALADGAFPDALQVLLPANHPDRIVVTATFGLLVSEGSAPFRFACEESIAPAVAMYQLGPPPDEPIFAISPAGLYRSGDGGCQWSRGAPDGARLFDAFPDPSGGAHVLALASLRLDAGVDQSAVYQSQNGGATFGPPIWVAPAGALLTGVEIARAAPQTLYLTGFFGDVDPRATRAFTVRSDDGGVTFQLTDASAALGTRALRLAAVDPIDPRRLYLRAVGQEETRDALALTDDGGATVRLALQLPARMSGFLRRSDGALLVATRDGDLYTSTDGGATFAERKGPHFRALAERAGTLYAATDLLADDSALATSSDGGATWKPALRFSQIAGPLACSSGCDALWQKLQQTLSGGAPDLGTTQPPRAGCTCALSEPAAAPPPLALLLFLWVATRLAMAPRRAGCSR